jgi:cell division protein FtsB
MPIPAPPGTASRRPSGPAPLRRKPAAPGRTSAITRKTVHFLLVFATIVLVVDSLVGEKGLLETLKVRRQHRELQASVEMLRQDNAHLREMVRRLNEDPAEIESVAREELGLIKPGEILFIVRDVRPAPTSR